MSRQIEIACGGLSWVNLSLDKCIFGLFSRINLYNVFLARRFGPSPSFHVPFHSPSIRSPPSLPYGLPSLSHTPRLALSHSLPSLSPPSSLLSSLPSFRPSSHALLVACPPPSLLPPIHLGLLSHWKAALYRKLAEDREEILSLQKVVGRHLVGVWIGGIWNDYFPESCRYFSRIKIER